MQLQQGLSDQSDLPRQVIQVKAQDQPETELSNPTRRLAPLRLLGIAKLNKCKDSHSDFNNAPVDAGDSDLSDFDADSTLDCFSPVPHISDSDFSPLVSPTPGTDDYQTVCPTLCIYDDHFVCPTPGINGNHTISSIPEIHGNHTVGPTPGIHDNRTVSPTPGIHGNHTVSPTPGIHGNHTVGPTPGIHDNRTVGPTTGIHDNRTMSPTPAIHNEHTVNPNPGIHYNYTVGLMESTEARNMKSVELFNKQTPNVMHDDKPMETANQDNSIVLQNDGNNKPIIAEPSEKALVDDKPQINLNTNRPSSYTIDERQKQK